MKKKKTKTAKINKKKKNTVFLTITIIALFVFVAIFVGFFIFRPLSTSAETEYVYIDNDDSADSVYAKLIPYSTSTRISSVKFLAGLTSFSGHIHTGRYSIGPRESILTVFRKIKNGNQATLNLVVGSVRTMDRLARDVSHTLLVDSATIYQALTDETVCQRYGFSRETMPAMFIPDTYDFFWNATVDNFLDRMKKQYDRFWNADRTAKAEALGLTKTDVATLASIVDEETANNAEKPTIAGLYYNRLRKGMLLQADPTVKFALGDFAARRILNSMLSVDSPYNTYRYKGLPPGPIRVPSVAGLDAVLNLEHHDYIFMCAKEDFSGTHNFAATAAEHMANAKKYHDALDARNIKK